MSSGSASDGTWSPKRPWGFPLAVAVVFALAHLPFLPPTLADIDSVNFALGVRQFDPSTHQPHPPGYPIYVALGKLSTAAFERVRPTGAGASAPSHDPGPAGAGTLHADNAALGLALWSTVFGALAAFPLLRLFRSFDGDGARCAPSALLLAMTCPLFWFTAVRPLSDVPGLAVALTGQALLATAFVARRTGAGGPHTAPPVGPSAGAALVASRRLTVAGAFVSALAVGLRSQTMWLTLPLLVVVLLDRRGRDAARAAAGSAVALAFGTVLWAVPMVIATGGMERYFGALAKQGGEDFSGVEMLWTHPTPRRLAMNLFDTLVVPWASLPLAAAVIVLALVGVLAMARRRPPAVVLLAAGFLPYAAFHLLFHETVTSRYALPLMLPLAYLAACGAGAIVGRFQAITAGALIATSLVVVVPPVARYGREASPISRTMAALRQRSLAEGGNAVLAMHRRALTETRRAFRWELGGATLWSRELPSPRRHEWLELVEYWTAGGDQPVWFLANPLRTDLALIDPASRRLLTAYRWPFPTEPFVGGVRPRDIDCYEICPPGWFLGEGWSLTPETGGVAAADGRGPDRGPIEAWVRRRPGAATLLVGGRNLGGPGDPAVRVDMTLEGRPVDSSIVRPAPGFFLRLIPLPDGSLAGSGRYARLTVSAVPADAGSPAVRVAIEQFDLQNQDQVVFGYAEGWHELEYDPTSGQLWRWTDESADIRVHGGGQALVLRVIGESPLRDFSRPSGLAIRAGGAPLGRHQASSAFSFEVTVPEHALEQAGGILTLDTDQTFVPDERSQNGDKRRLGLRIYSLTLRPADEVIDR